MTPRARRVRGHVYRILAATGTAPRTRAIAGALSSDPADVRAALAELSDVHAVILDAEGEVEWALPFSAVPTPYRVAAGRVTWHAPCAWDALAIGPLLGRLTHVDARCPDCGDALRVEVRPAAAALVAPSSRTEAVVHFARAARDWWADIRET